MPITPFIGRPDLVAHIGEELALCTARGLRLADRLRQSEVGLADLCLRLLTLADVAQDARHTRESAFLIEKKLAPTEKGRTDPSFFLRKTS